MSKILPGDSDVIETHHYSHSDKETTIRAVQDVEPYLSRNGQERAIADNKWGGDMHKVASIPIIVIEQWTKELGDNPLSKHNRPWLVAKLNDKSFSKLRTKEGRI